MRMLLALLLFVLAVAVWGLAKTHAQERDKVQFICQNGYCYLTEADADRVIKAIEWAARKLAECGAI